MSHLRTLTRPGPPRPTVPAAEDPLANPVARGASPLLQWLPIHTNKKEVMRLYDRPRPHAVSYVGDRVKLHRRVVRANGRDYTVISPRPGTDVRFATNFYHGTWHILSDARGARLLGRLLWGLAYTRVPGTVVLIDGPFLSTEPFEGTRADPILLVSAHLTPLTDRSAADLRRALPRARAEGTVRWHTHGLDAEVAAARRVRLPGEARRRYDPPVGPERVGRLGGFVSVAASPGHLRDYATSVYQLADYLTFESEHVYLGWGQCHRADGEVQIFRGYRARVSSARVARREVLAGGATERVDELIWARAADVRHRGRFRPTPREGATPAP